MPGEDYQANRQHQAQEESAKSQNELGNVFWYDQASLLYW